LLGRLVRKGRAGSGGRANAAIYLTTFPLVLSGPAISRTVISQRTGEFFQHDTLRDFHGQMITEQLPNNPILITCQACDMDTPLHDDTR
jgi:hypothetical protein